MTIPHCALARLAAAITLATLAVPSMAQVQAWPVKTVRIMVGSPPGGPSDITTRLFAEQLQLRTGKAVVVE
ncbi:MAG: tripartite tricarboxylate transporter substrate binding protein, partial [Comamonadaceae bacterium]